MKKAAFAYLAMTGTALAHSGHAEAVSAGDAHWLMQADHLAVVGLAALALVLVLGSVRSLLRQSRRQHQG